MAMPGNASVHVSAVYTRHRPEQTLLYRIVEEHYTTFRDLLERQRRPLPAYLARVVMSF